MQIEHHCAIGQRVKNCTENAFHPTNAHLVHKKRVFGKDLTNQQVTTKRDSNANEKSQSKARWDREDWKEDLDEVQKPKLVEADSVDSDDSIDSMPPNPELPPWDASDVDDDLNAVEYAGDIMMALREQEAGRSLGDFMTAQQDINCQMRAKLVDWLTAVQRRFELSEPTFFLAINMIDRFLAAKMLKRTKLQLLGCSCLWIASKYHDLFAPAIIDFVTVSANCFSSEQFLSMEVEVLKTLSFELMVPTVLDYADRYSKISVEYLKKERERKILCDLIMYCAEHSVMSYALCQRAPSLVGAACFVFSSLSTKVFTLDTFHGDGLERVIGYSMDALLPAMRDLDAVLKRASRSKHKAVFKKYCSAKRSSIGKINFRTLDVSFLAPE